MLPAILPAFQEMYPNVKIQIVEGPSAELDKKLLNMEVDLAFYNQRFGDTNPLIQTKILGEEELLICVKKGHPMERFAQPNPASKYPRLDVRLLQNETILLMLKNQRTRQIIDQYLHQQGVVFENILHTSNIPAIMELISVGYGVSFLFEPHILQHNFKNPISCFSFGEPRTTSALVVATRKNSYLPSFANDYIELAKRLYINI
jgi:DNA-binding transcriptional LysR family regulator